MRGLSHPGADLRPLRPWPDLLRRRVRASCPPPDPTCRRRALPDEPPGAAGTCGPGPALPGAPTDNQLPTHLRPLTLEIPATWTPEEALALQLVVVESTDLVAQLVDQFETQKIHELASTVASSPRSLLAAARKRIGA